MICDKCEKKAPTNHSHIGKKHRQCGNRKWGESKELSGRWQDENTSSGREPK